MPISDFKTKYQIHYFIDIIGSANGDQLLYGDIIMKTPYLQALRSVVPADIPQCCFVHHPISSLVFLRVQTVIDDPPKHNVMFCR